MKYAKKHTIAFAKSLTREDCLQDLNTLIIKEGCTNPMPVFADDELVLDMDCVEHILAIKEKRARFKSMDSAIITNNEAGDQKILLVEFRFNYINLKNLNKSDLIGKVDGSTNALRNPPNLHDKKLFIFSSELKQQAIRRINQLLPTRPNNYIATDVLGLKELSF